MTSERLRQIEEMYHAAIARSGADRAQFLRDACAGDEALRAEVEALVAQESGAAFLDTLAVAEFGSTLTRPGSLVGCQLGAYRVTATLGAGGMGEVYRATDTRLGRDVAIKVLPAAFGASAERLQRFEQEARLLAALNHPNIGAIYGLEETEGVRGLILELVEGPTLADCLTDGPMGVPEALSIARQIADALKTAHEKGIIHRDLKPANIKITPEGVVKVLDFGIAKATAVDAVRSQTREGVLLGTAAYMSPEQARGHGIDSRTDIWAFGCVFYEMLTGKAAFAGNTEVDTIAAILGREPDWRLLPPEVQPSLRGLIRRCLEKERDERVADIGEARAEIERIRAEAAQRRSPLRRWWPLSAAAIGTALVGLSMITGAPAWRERLARSSDSASRGEASVRTPIKTRRALAVIGFKNLSRRAETAWLSPALSETLTTELAASSVLRAIPGESVARMKIDLALADADSFAPDTLTRIRNNTGADLLILGSYLAIGKDGEARIRLDLILQDARTGELVATVTETGAESELLELMSRTGARLRQKLGVAELSNEESTLMRASLPSNREAVRLYSEGVEKLRLFDALLARGLLEKAVAADPGHALAHSALASAWSTLGYDERAVAEAKRALDLAGKLSREQRLAIEGSYREITHEWDKAAEIYKALWTVFPDNLEYGLRLADVRSAGGRGREALAVIDDLRALPAPAKDDPRIDLAEGRAAESLSDFKRQLAAAQRAAATGQAQGARLLLARARLLEGRGFHALGEPAKSAAASEEAKDIYAASGDRAGAAAALNNIASVLDERGEVTRARQMHEQAVEICRQIGNKKGMANALNNIALILKDRGDLEGARKVHEQVVALRREIGDRSGTATSLNNIGVVFFEQGNLGAAKRMYQDSLSICREIGDKRGAVRAMLNFAIVLTREGDLAAARKLHEESLALRRELGDKRAVVIALINLSDVLFNQGDLAGAASSVRESLAISREIDSKRSVGYALFMMGELLAAGDHLSDARQAHEEALAVRKQLGEALTVIESHSSLAALAIEEGRIVEAEALARSAAEEAQRVKQIDSEGFARAILARAFLAQGKPVEATREMARSLALSGRSENRQLRLTMSIINARVSAASGQAAAAVSRLDSTLREALTTGMVGLQLEARLALGEIELGSGKSSTGRLRLDTLGQEASAKGFALIARKAAEASRRN